MDKYELWSRRYFQKMDLDAEAALLIGYPFSPVASAARQLRKRGIPYVVDIGDPWALTGPGMKSPLKQWRAARAERDVWHGAAGAIVTTAAQADALVRLFPRLNPMVQPNGYEPMPIATAPRRTAPDEIKLVHFGNLYEARLDLTGFLETLLRHADGRALSFTNFGSDWARTIRRWPSEVQVLTEPPIPWQVATQRAYEFDLALVIGNRSPMQLPSKAVQYGTLPIPRLAVTNGTPGDALWGYAAERSGWLAVVADDGAAGVAVLEHLRRGWNEVDLAPDPSEAWPAVADRIVGFVAERTGLRALV